MSSQRIIMPDLAIVIVSYNAREDLLRCLTSLHEPPLATPHEILVVDNASADGSPAQVRARWPDVRVIAAGSNVGFAQASNIGIRQSAGELVLLLNSDTIVPAHAIDRLVADLRNSPDTAVMGPRIIDAAGRAELSFGRMMGPVNETVQKVLVRLHARDVPIVARHVERKTRRPQLVDWVSGACLLVRRGAAEAAGLLDERYFLYAEDVDFCAAIRARGWHVRFNPRVEIVHRRGRSRAAAPTASELAYRASQLAFYAKHHPRWLPWLRLYLRLSGKSPLGHTRTI